MNYHQNYRNYIEKLEHLMTIFFLQKTIWGFQKIIKNNNTRRKKACFLMVNKVCKFIF